MQHKFLDRLRDYAKTTRFPRRSSMALLLGAVFCLVLNLSTFRLLSRLPDKIETSPVDYLNALRTGSITDDLLLDAIVSIVQSYYVDAKRVDGAALFEQTVRNLSRSPDVSFTIDRSREELSVRTGDRSHAFSIRSPLDHESMLSYLETLSDNLAKQDAEKELSWHERGHVRVVTAMLSALDAHSSLLSPDAYEELRQGTEGSFGGLGILVGMRNEKLTVIKPLAKSPALRAGLEKHDHILSINGRATFGYTLDQLVEHMRGEPGTEVKLRYLRDGAFSPKAIAMQREVIQVDSVVSTDISRGGKAFLKVKVESFSSRTAAEVLSALSAFRNEHNGRLHGLVLDLRSNPGGLLDQAVKLADLFLKKGVIVTTRGRRDEVEAAGSDYFELDYPIAVLINSDSASASEIVAGALQDHNRAVLIGQPSFGKGSVQTIFELPGKQALKLTIARYYTPLGRSIQNVGIMPDVWLQPVYEKERNHNLLGNYRYKSERFLRNRLHAIVSDRLRKKAEKDLSFQGYYLSPPITIDSHWQTRKDPEQEIALSLLTRVADTYGAKLPLTAQRAGHWLALGSVEMNQAIARHTARVKKWLRQKHGTSWTRPLSEQGKSEHLRVGLRRQPNSVATAGELFAIPWTLKNTSDRPIHNVSLFVTSERGSFETTEKLVGIVPPHTKVSGTIKVRIPGYYEPGPLPLSVGASVDAMATPAFAPEIVVHVEKKVTTSLQAEMSITEESGQIAGVLEPNEKAKAILAITNEGSIDAHQVNASIFNLSGKQLNVAEQSVRLGTIPAGATRRVLLDVQAASAVLSQKLSIGVRVKSADLVYPLRQSLSIEGQPAPASVARMAKDVAH